MSITLNQILNLVGKLDDAPGDDTPVGPGRCLGRADSAHFERV
ncbi:MAG: hypothetical protein ABIN58_06155 [candidate division WOR-3 bacterium]